MATFLKQSSSCSSKSLTPINHSQNNDKDIAIRICKINSDELFRLAPGHVVYKETTKFDSSSQKHSFVMQFICSDSKIKFRLIIAKAPEDQTSHLLCRVSLVEWGKIEIIKERHTKSFDWIYKTGQKTYNEQEYLSYDQCRPFMLDGSVTFACEVEILEETAVVLDKNDAIDEFGTLLKSGKLRDMILSAGGKDFPVHKAFLAARSPVFGAMFENKDSKEVQEGQISIEDMSSEVCNEMLKHIYTDRTPSNMSEFAFDLYVAADKYQLTKLKWLCEDALINLLDVDTVSSVLLIADGCNAENLKSKCIEFFSSHSAEVMKTEQWKQIADRKDLLLELLQQLSNISEHHFSNCNKKLKVN